MSDDWIKGNIKKMLVSKDMNVRKTGELMLATGSYSFANECDEPTGNVFGALK